MRHLSQFNYCPKCGSRRFVENNFKSERCEDCGFVYYFNACGATVAIILNDKNELLVATRAHEPAIGTLDLPGGFIDMNETAEEAVCREVKEETGLDITEVKYLFSLPNIYLYSGFEVQTIDLFFWCKANSYAVLKPDDDVARLEFIEVGKLRPELFGLASIRKGISLLMKNINKLTT